jgi:hypothetical protein
LGLTCFPAHNFYNCLKAGCLKAIAWDWLVGCHGMDLSGHRVFAGLGTDAFRHVAVALFLEKQ